MKNHPRYQIKNSANRKVDGTQPSGFATKSKEKFLKNSKDSSSENGLLDYESELNQVVQKEPSKSAGPVTRSKGKYLKNSEDLSSSEDEISNYESELNLVVGKEPLKSAGPITRSNSMQLAKISAIRDEVNNTRTQKSAGFATKSKGKHLKKSEDGTSDCASEPSQVASKSKGKDLKKSEDGTLDCASELKRQPQFHVASKQARGFAGRVARNNPKNPRRRTKVSEIREKKIDVPLLRQTIEENVDRYLFDLHELFDAEDLLKTGLFAKVHTLAVHFLDDLFVEIKQKV